MATRREQTFKISVDRKDFRELMKIKKRDGIPASEQVRRALTLWLKARDQQPTTTITVNGPPFNVIDLPSPNQCEGAK